MSSTMDLIKSGAQRMASGEELTSNTVDSSVDSHESTGVDILSPDDTNSISLMAENSTMEDLLPKDDEDISKDLQSEEPASSKAPKAVPSKETLIVTDDKGRRKVEVDFNDREQLKKHIQMAYGARKWQAERDQALQSQKGTQKELADLRGQWEKLEKAFQQGEEHLIDLVKGPGHYRRTVQKELERARFLENASPDEIQALESREKADRHVRELEQMRAENEQFRKQVAADREQAELHSVEARVHPVFDKYRFADKLGSADDEQMFDELLWNSALKRLQPYEEQGLDLSPELVEREFRNVAMSIRRRIGVQAEKKASKALDQKKQEATENVQTKVKSGYKTGGAASEARSLIESGNLTGLLKGWNKYGNLFRK